MEHCPDCGKSHIHCRCGAPDKNTVVLLKHDESFYFTFDDSPKSIPKLLGVLGRFAVDESLDFNWKDVATVAQRAQRLAAEAKH